MIPRAQVATQAYTKPRARPLVLSETGANPSESPRAKYSTVRQAASKWQPLGSQRPAGLSQLKKGRLVAERARRRALQYKARCRAYTHVAVQPHVAVPGAPLCDPNGPHLAPVLCEGPQRQSDSETNRLTCFCLTLRTTKWNELLHVVLKRLCAGHHFKKTVTIDTTFRVSIS